MLLLRNRGWTVYAIAQEMGVSEGTVKNRINEALAARVDPKVDEYRKRQNASGWGGATPVFSWDGDAAAAQPRLDRVRHRA
jgi:hypothetical protein